MIRWTPIIRIYRMPWTIPRNWCARTTEALNNGISTMTIVQNTLKDSSDDFDAAAT